VYYLFRKRFSLVVLLLAFLFYGCDVLGIGKVVQPEEMKHYKPEGALVAFTVDITKHPRITTVRFMFSRSSSVSVFPSKYKNYYLADMPLSCKGINRIGLSGGVHFPDIWFDNYVSPFSLESNKVNYLGRFIFEADKDPDRMLDKMIVSNCIDEDKVWFLEYYPSLSNTEFISVPVTNGQFFRVR